MEKPDAAETDEPGEGEPEQAEGLAGQSERAEGVAGQPALPEEPLVVERDDGLKHLPSVRAHAFLGLVRAGTALARDLNARLEAAHGISLHGFEVLLHLAVFSPDGCLGLGRLAKQTPLSQSRVSRLVAQLAADGLVARGGAANDARGVDVSITDAGLEKFRHAQETHLADLDERLFSRLTWDDVVRLASITGKLLDDDHAQGHTKQAAQADARG